MTVQHRASRDDVRSPPGANVEGSAWKKWDLHFQTPFPVVHNYPGEEGVAWAAFLRNLEKLSPEFKVVGINGYIFLDGYERALEAKLFGGRHKNIDLMYGIEAKLSTALDCNACGQAWWINALREPRD